MTARFINNVSLRNRMRTIGYGEEIFTPGFLFTGPLDNFASLIGLAYSDRRLLYSYIGPVARVRVSGVGNAYHNNEYDVYPYSIWGPDVGTGGIDRFCRVVCRVVNNGSDVVGTERQMSDILNTGAPANLFYTRRYDQTGSQYYLEQSDPARQRKLTSTAGTLNYAPVDFPQVGLGKTCGLSANTQGMEQINVPETRLVGNDGTGYGTKSTVFMYQRNSNTNAEQLRWLMLNETLGYSDIFRVAYGGESSLTWELGTTISNPGRTFTASVPSSINQLTIVRDGTYAALYSGISGLIGSTNNMSRNGLLYGLGVNGRFVEGNTPNYVNGIIGVVPETIIFKTALFPADINTIASEQHYYWSSAAWWSA